MDKVLTWVTDITLLVFGILFLTLSFLSLMNYVYDEKVINQYKLNWSKGPIREIINTVGGPCPSGYEPFISNTFPGHTIGCNCLDAINDGYKGKIYTVQCTESNIAYGCKMIFDQPAIILSVWKGVTLCVMRMKRNFWELESNASNECQIGKKKCGILDTTGNMLCLEPEQKCPINKLELRPKNSPPTYPAEKIALNGLNDLYFTNTFTNNKVIIEFVVSPGPICVHPYEGLLGQNDYILNKLKGKYECSTSIDGNLSDNRFIIIDTENLLKFYEENKINQLIKETPGYPTVNPDKSVKLFEINYFGWDKRCHNNNEFELKNIVDPKQDVDTNNKSTFGFAIICTTHFVLVVGTILIYKIIIMAFSTHYLLMLIFEGINFLFVFTIFIYSIVMIAATNKLLLPFNDFINLNCGDTFTNSVIKWAFQGLTSVNSTLIPIAVLSGLELGYLIFFYTYVIIKKNSQGYIELSDRDRNE